MNTNMSFVMSAQQRQQKAQTRQHEEKNKTTKREKAKTSNNAYFFRENLALKTLPVSINGNDNMFFSGQLVENVNNDIIVKSLQPNLKADKRSLFGFIESVQHLALNSDFFASTQVTGQQMRKFKKADIYEMLQSLRSREPNLIIENVYQEKYGEVNASGIGDFLRGSYYIMQFCDRFGFRCSINMSHHPLAEFLEVYQPSVKPPLEFVSVFGKNNFFPLFLADNVLSNKYNEDVDDNFIYFLSQQVNDHDQRNDQIEEGKLVTYVISYPKTPVPQKYKAYMQKLLKPTDWFLNKIYRTLSDIGLQAKKYVVVHIRYGDKFLVENQGRLYTKHVQIIENMIKQISLNDEIFLLADNDLIKGILTNIVPRIKTHYNSITHTGEGIKIEKEKLENTLTDFYFFAMSKEIMAFSVYSHGTGFSKWAAETFDVPYVCRFLPPLT